MKRSKTLLLLLVAGTVVFAMGLLLYSTMAELSIMEYATAGIVLILVLFSIVIALKRIRNENRGLPADDELSQQIKIKAAANAFSFSFFLWIMILLFTSKTQLDIEVIIGIGILGMGALFFGFWIYYTNKGIIGEN